MVSFYQFYLGLKEQQGAMMEWPRQKQLASYATK